MLCLPFLLPEGNLSVRDVLIVTSSRLRLVRWSYSKRFKKIDQLREFVVSNAQNERYNFI